MMRGNDNYFKHSMDIEAAKQELRELESRPLEHPKPIKHRHPFLDAQYWYGVEPFPIINPNPSVWQCFMAMHRSDWIIVGISWMGIMTLALKRCNWQMRTWPVLSTAVVATPVFLGWGAFNAWTRLVGLKGVDQI
jgi:hypothetical protein